MRPSVLVIGGTPEEQLSIIENLEDAGYLADSVETPENALRICQTTQVHIVISSLHSVEHFGLAAYRTIQEKVPALHFILTVPRERIPHLDLPGLTIGQVVPAPFLLRDLLKAVRRSSSPWLSLSHQLRARFSSHGEQSLQKEEVLSEPYSGGR